MLRIIGYLLEIYVIILVVRALLSWIPVRSGSPVAPFIRALDAITEPVLRPVRKMMPGARVGGVSLDFSVLLVVIVLQVVSGILIRQ